MLNRNKKSSLLKDVKVKKNLQETNKLMIVKFRSDVKKLKINLKV